MSCDVIPSGDLGPKIKVLNFLSDLSKPLDVLFAAQAPDLSRVGKYFKYQSLEPI